MLKYCQEKYCEIGVNAIELDVLLTVDSKIVVHHDYFLKSDIARTSDGKWLPGDGPAINTTTLNELKIYDVGRLKPNTRYAKRYPEQEPTAVDFGGRREVLDIAMNGIRYCEERFRVNLIPFLPSDQPPATSNERPATRDKRSPTTPIPGKI